VWSSLYQQRPTAAEGGLFKRGDWRYWESYADEHGSPMLRLEADRYALADCQRFATLDLATSTKRSADFTVACVWAITPGGDLVLLDRARDRVPEIDHAAFLAPLRQRWLTPYDVTHIESRMFGTTLVYALGRDGVPVAELDADVDKLTRALPAAGLVRQHRVWLPSTAAWLDEWLDEHADFPNVAHDDQVDNTGYAARVAIAHWLPPEDAVTSEARRMADLTRDPDDVDLMSAPM
jgi:predicted phage terminase large subunit-like protein